MSTKQTVACLALTLCLAACEASTPSPATDATAPSPQNPALQALVAKTKKNLVFVEGGTFQMGDFGMVHNAAKLPYYGALDTMPLHTVTLDSFSIAAYKTTYEDYDFYTEATGQKKLRKIRATSNTSAVQPLPVFTGKPRVTIANGWVSKWARPWTCLLKRNGSMPRATGAKW